MLDGGTQGSRRTTLGEGNYRGPRRGIRASLSQHLIGVNAATDRDDPVDNAGNAISLLDNIATAAPKGRS